MTYKINDLSTGAAADAMQLETDTGGTTSNKLALSALATYVGTKLAPSATTDTTNATNITSGALPAAQLPNPAASTLGGVKSLASVTSNWINSISTGGLPVASQPAFTDISGTIAGSQVNSGVFASKPAAATAGAGALYFATDVGLHGTLILSNGTIWKPVNGIATLWHGYVNASHTGDQVETNLQADKINAGLLSANGMLSITSQWTFPNNADNKTTLIRLSTTSGDTSTGTLYLNDTETAKATSKWLTEIINANATNSQVGHVANLSSYGASSGTVITSAIDSTAAMYLNFNYKNNTSNSDTGTLVWRTVKWIEA